MGPAAGHLVVVSNPRGYLTHDGLGIGTWIDANIIPLDGANEGLGHPVALRAFDRCRSRLQADLPCDPAT